MESGDGIELVTASQSQDELEVVSVQEKKSETGRIYVVLALSLIVCIGGVIGGYSHGFPSPTLLDLQNLYENGDRVNSFPSNSFYAGLFGAIGPIGGLFGGSIAGPVSDKIGRSAALVMMTLPHLIGWLAQAYAHWIPNLNWFITVLMLGRWFTGFGTGWGSLVISVYMVEISPARLKGLFGSMYWLSTAVGILLVYGLGAIPGFTYYDLSLSTAGLVIPCAFLYCFLPESPRWLVSHRKPKNAYRVLKLLRGSETDVSVEMEELTSNFAESEKLTWKSKVKYLTNKTAYKPLAIITILMFFQQFTGTNVVVFYAGTILADAKVEDAIKVAGYAVGTTQVIAVLISVMIVDVVGRKALLVLSSVLVCVSTGFLGLYYFLTDFICVKYYHLNSTSSLLSNASDVPLFCDPVSSKFFVVAILSVVLFIVAFSLGWSTIPWVMMSELSPLRVRGIYSSIATAVNWSSAAFLTGIFPIYQNVVEHYGSWWTLTGITLLSVPFVLLCVPETKKQSLEQIEKGIKANKNAETKPLLT